MCIRDRKAESINGDHIRALDPEDFRNRLIPYLQVAGVLGETLTERQEQVLTEAAPLVQERMQLLGEAPGLLAFLFKADEEISTCLLYTSGGHARERRHCAWHRSGWRGRARTPRLRSAD